VIGKAYKDYLWRLQLVTVACYLSSSKATVFT